jgi:hypothetical protein
MITCLEWDGTQNSYQPDIKVVGWRYDDSHPRSRIVRSVLNRKTFVSGDDIPPNEEDTHLQRDDSETFFTPMRW